MTDFEKTKICLTNLNLKLVVSEREHIKSLVVTNGHNDGCIWFFFHADGSFDYFDAFGE